MWTKLRIAQTLTSPLRARSASAASTGSGMSMRSADVEMAHPRPMGKWRASTKVLSRFSTIKMIHTSERSVASGGEGKAVYWRGLKDTRVQNEFMELGGTECAPMSTTNELAVAMEYSASKHPVLMRLLTESFMQRGASLAFLSCFPAEAETLFPPLTYLKPSCKYTITVKERGATIRVTIIDITPHIG